MNTGWEKLYGARRYHYFEDRKSLCGQWTLSLLDRHYLVSDDRMPDDDLRCKVCEQRRRQKLTYPETI